MARAGEPAEAGLLLERPGGGFVRLRIVDQVFELVFLGPDRRPVIPDRARAVVRVSPPTRKTAPEVHALESAPDGRTLRGVRFVRPPHVFRVAVLLHAAGAEEAAETLHGEFRP